MKENETNSPAAHTAPAAAAIAAATPVLRMIIAFASKTVAETARLWLFLVPLIVLVATRELADLLPRRLWLGVELLAAVQLLTTFALKMWQDFC